MPPEDVVVLPQVAPLGPLAEQLPSGVFLAELPTKIGISAIKQHFPGGHAICAQMYRNPTLFLSETRWDSYSLRGLFEEHTPFPP